MLFHGGFRGVLLHMSSQDRHDGWMDGEQENMVMMEVHDEGTTTIHTERSPLLFIFGVELGGWSFRNGNWRMKTDTRKMPANGQSQGS